MENDGIIRKIEHHTDWCSSITTSVKKDGSLRVCLDPKCLIDSLKRCPQKIPTLEELNPEFAEARVFSKMDAKAGYWSIHLDETSQEITTFRTPFGRYCYKRLPFGLCVSQDLFQQAMDRILARPPEIEKTRLLMRKPVYWPNIYKDKETMVKCSTVCQESQTEHRQQPLLAHDVPSTPWTKVASDMFQIKGDNYLLITDYHSKFYLVEKMHSTTSIAIANKSAQWFSMFGPPLEIVTDNVPHVT